MGLIVCDYNEVLHPYFIPELDLNIYSYEELCFIIYENPVLVRDRFITTALLDFIELELGLTALKSRLLKMRKDRASEDEMLIYILSFGNIYSSSEILRYKKLLEYFKRAHKADYLLLKGNYMFRLGLFGRAANDYNKILRFGKDKVVSNKFLAIVHENLGSTYANLFQYMAAYEEYEKAFLIASDLNILKKMYHISLIDPSVILKEEYLDHVNKMDRDLWDQEYLDAIDRAAEAGRVREIQDFFKQGEPAKKEVQQLLNRFKQEYRRMN